MRKFSFLILISSSVFAADNEIDAGLKYSWAKSQSNGSGKAVYAIKNPAGSGVNLYVDQVICTSVDGAAYWTLRSYSSTLSNNDTSAICNAKFGAGNSVAKVYYEKSASTPGNLHSEDFGNAGVSVRFESADGSPIIQIIEGRGMVAVQHPLSGDPKSVCNFHWREY